MRKFAISLAIAILAISPLMRTSAQAQENRSPLSMASDDGSIIHIFPSIGGGNALASLLSDTGPLNYNGGRRFGDGDSDDLRHLLGSATSTEWRRDGHVDQLPAHLEEDAEGLPLA
jgi:hypothetical protein